MTPQDQRILVLTTCPDESSAETIGRRLVEARLAACVNILPRCRSIYRWEGAVEDAQEWVLLIKSRTARYAALEQAIVQAHPYELPEVICVPIHTGLPGYLCWIDEMTSET